MDDLYIRPKYNFLENIDYMDKSDISVYHLYLCWKQNNSLSIKSGSDDISSRIPSTVSRRLENICWRRVQKELNNLGEISPSQINWNKDMDITWLYGPKFTNEDPFDTRLTSDTLSKFNSQNASGLENDDLSSVGLVSSLSFYESSSLASSEEDCSDFDHLRLKPVLKVSNDYSKLTNDKKARKTRKLVQFSSIVNSREYLNELLFDYNFLDTLCD